MPFCEKRDRLFSMCYKAPLTRPRIFSSFFSDQLTFWAVSKTDLPSRQPLGQRPVHFSQMPSLDYLPYQALRGSQVSEKQIKSLNCKSVSLIFFKKPYLSFS